MYRFVVKDPRALSLAMPVGKESGAYQKEWVFGGKTLGATVEAVVSKLSLDQLKQALTAGALEIGDLRELRQGRRDVDWSSSARRPRRRRLAAAPAAAPAAAAAPVAAEAGGA